MNLSHIGPRTCDVPCSVLCSHMLLANLRYVVTSFWILIAGWTLPCIAIITVVYLWTELRYYEKVTLFKKEQNETVLLLGKPILVWKPTNCGLQTSGSGVHCGLWGKRKQYDYHCRGNRHLYKVLYLHSRIPRGLNRRRLEISDWEFGTACAPWQRKSAAFIFFDTILMVQQFGQTIC